MMRMKIKFYQPVRVYSLVIFVFFLMLGVSNVISPKLYAEDSTINATLFSATQSPEIIITQPANGAVVGSSSLNITGSTVNATEVRVYLNGELVITVDSSLGQFLAILSLIEGRNEIRIEGFSSYSNLSSQKVIFVTYAKDDGSNPGGVVDTDGNNHSSGLSQGGQIIPGSPNSGFFGNLKQNLDFSNYHSSFVKPLSSWLLIIIGIAFAALAIYLKLIKTYLRKLNKVTILTIRITLLILALLFLYLAQL